MGISVTSAIPGGSIDVIDVNDPADIRLRLRKDPGADPLAIGYYYFRVSGGRGIVCRFRLVNVAVDAAERLAGRAAYEDEWTGTGPHVSYDRMHWFRIAGEIVGSDYVICLTPTHDVFYVAKWAPYSQSQDLALIARCQAAARVRVETVAKSVAGADVDLITIGEPEASKRVCWIVARQHPSETMGGYFIEGLMNRLIDPNDPVTRALLHSTVIYVVPNMNPDGARLGFTRCNAAGVNLNREWLEPSLERSPEVLSVRARMEMTGVDLCLDCHGDEEMKCVFLAGPPSRVPRIVTLLGEFERAWAQASPDYELGHPYPGGVPEKPDLRMAWNWIGERFDCLSMLLEQPFKDTSWRQDSGQGWSPERATLLGASLPHALLAVLPSRRA